MRRCMNRFHRPNTDDSQVGQWCVVKYEWASVTGHVNEIEVKVMHRIGLNRFFGPMLEDILWYSHCDNVAYIGQPNAVGSRHYKLSQAEWEFIAKSLNM